MTRVLHGDSAEVVGDSAPTLLLGDSFTTMFRDRDAGLGSQLILRLGRGVQTLADPGITPAELLHRVAARPEVLAHKKLVIWTFVDRTVVTVKSWEAVQLPNR